MEDRYLSIKEASKLMDVCENTLRDWDIEKKFRAASRTTGGHRRYSLEQIREYLDKNATKSDEAKSSNDLLSVRDNNEHLLEVWDGTGLLTGLESRNDRLTLAILLENGKIMHDLAQNPVFSSNQMSWLTAESWKRCRFRKMVTVQPLSSPCGFVYFADETSSHTLVKSHAVVASTIKVDFSVFLKANFEGVKEAYADAMAMTIDMNIIQKLPIIHIDTIQDMIREELPLNLSQIYDYVIAPENIADMVRDNPGFAGVEVHGIPACLDPESFRVCAAAGKYPKTKMSLPVFSPYILLFESGIRLNTGTASLMSRCGWTMAKDIKS